MRLEADCEVQPPNHFAAGFLWGAGGRTGREGSVVRLVRASMMVLPARVSPRFAFFGHTAAIGLAIQSCPALFRRRSFAFARPRLIVESAPPKIDKQLRLLR